MPTPSISRQRIVLVLLLVLIGAAAWWQDADRDSDPSVQKFSLAASSDAFRELDFTNAEAAWRELQIDSEGQLQINALTETALTESIALLKDHRDAAAIGRLAFLLEKQFGATVSEQISELLPRLQRYKEAEQLWWATRGSEDPPAHAELFALQDELLGETLAKQLFSEQRHLMHLMLASQQIRNDMSLTQEQRDQALLDLQKAGGLNE